MKKLIVGLVAVLVLFAGFTMWNQKNNGPAVAAASTAAPAEMPSPEAAPVETPAPKVLDYEAIRALFPEDTVALTLGDESLDWGFYADWLRANGMQYEDYFRQMAAYYGVSADWTGSVGDGSGMTYAQAMLQETGDTLSSFMAIRAFAKEKGVELDEETQKSLEPETMAVTLCGEGATVEKLTEELEKDSHMTLDGFLYYSESVALYSALYQELYGAKGEKLSEEEVVDALEADGYLSATHILFMTIDPMTGAALDEETVAKKLEQAEAVVKELRAIEDPEKRLARFAELKDQYCEDTGKEVYPDGYTFVPGVMVAEFEDCIKAQEDYEVSDPVKTSYGYHVIMRLPLSADSVLTTTSSQPMAARESVAQNSITKQLDAYFEAHPVTYAEEIKDLDLTQYLVDAE